MYPATVISVNYALQFFHILCLVLKIPEKGTVAPFNCPLLAIRASYRATRTRPYAANAHKPLIPIFRLLAVFQGFYSHPPLHQSATLLLRYKDHSTTRNPCRR